MNRGNTGATKTSYVPQRNNTLTHIFYTSPSNFATLGVTDYQNDTENAKIQK